MYVVNEERRNPIDFGSKVKVILGTLCIKPFGHNTDYSFSPITLKLLMEVVDDERRSLIDFGLDMGFNSKFKVKVNFGALCIKPCRHDTDFTMFTALTNCEWWKEEPCWFWIVGSKVNVCLWNLVRIIKTRQFLPDHFWNLNVCFW